MPKFRIDLDDETYASLAAIGLEERRPLHWQAEWMLTQAVKEWIQKRQQYTQALPHLSADPVPCQDADDARPHEARNPL